MAFVNRNGIIVNGMTRHSEVLGEEVQVHAQVDADLNVKEMDPKEVEVRGD